MNAAKWITASQPLLPQQRRQRIVSCKVELMQPARRARCGVAAGEIVDHGDVVALLEQQPDGVGTDVAGAAGNENSCVSSLTAIVVAWTILCQTEQSCSCERSSQLGIDTIFTLVGDHLNEVLAVAARAAASASSICATNRASPTRPTPGRGSIAGRRSRWSPAVRATPIR